MEKLQTVLDYLLNEFKEELKRSAEKYDWGTRTYTILEGYGTRHARLDRLRKEINVVLKKMGG